MKTTNTIMRVLSVLFISIFITSCSPEDGKDGKDGIDGIYGIDGTNGQQGPIGNANVIVSGWKTATNIQTAVIDDSNVNTGIVNAPEITSNILENSAVFTYLKFGVNVYPLPYISYAGGKPSTISYTPQVGNVKIVRFTHDNSNSMVLPSHLQYKYVIIPKAANAQRLMSNENRQEKFILNEELYMLEELKAMSYEEMCILLNISE